MKHNIKSIRAFIGAKNYNRSRAFYLDFGFYLQDACVKDWVNNSIIFLEVKNVEDHLTQIKKLNLNNKYKNVKISEIHYNYWGNEYFIHDPSRSALAYRGV